MEDIILSFKNCTKMYPGVVALNKVSLDVKRGEVHALIGENGAGKSTLIKCLSGAAALDGGQIEINGKSYDKMTPKLSRSVGVEVVYQELNLIDGLTIAENICFGEEYGKIVNYSLLEDKARTVFEHMQIEMDPKKLVRGLSVAQKQLVEIAKALCKNVKLLVMDEPTSSLTVDEIESLFKIIETLKKDGVTIIYISHRLDELFRICDSVSIMRDGCLVETRGIENLTKKKLIELMVGRELASDFPKRSHITDEKMLELEGITGNGVKNISLFVNKGEIVGLCGLVGSGRTELANVIFGAAKAEKGTIKIKGEVKRIGNTQTAIHNGIGLIPEDRKLQGCFLTFGIDWNITIANVKKFSKGLTMQTKVMKEVADKYIGQLKVKTPSPSQKVMNLSGGNQQKVVLAKTLATDAEIIIFDEPTRGIDVGAKQEIYKLMTSLADEGKAILMISSDMEELLGMSDRIYVLSEGHLTGEVMREEATQVRLMEMMSQEVANE